MVLSLFIQPLLPPKAAKSRDIPRKFDFIAVQGHPKSSILVQIESACNVLLVIITARCTLVQSAVLRSHVVCLSVCLSVRLSVTLVDCDHIGWNSSKIISPLVSLGCSLFASPTWRVCSKGNTPKFGPKVTHPLLIWASETFIANCGRMVTDIAQRSQWRAYRKLPSLFLMVQSLTP